MPAYTIKPLVTAIAINTGGRNGHSETTDHSVSVNLSVRKEMGGPGLPDTTTPEHLFAAGYAACFGGAIEFVAHAAEGGSPSFGRRDAREGLSVHPCDAWKH
jgi:lipoyl-dependent peroxiredoxin